MSAFFVNEAVVDDVLKLWAMSLPRVPRDEAMVRRGRDLLHMNAEAMVQRYPSIRESGEYDDYRTKAGNYRPQVNSSNVAQLLKSAMCLHYQCSEGDVPETDPLYAWLTALIAAQPAQYADSDAYGAAVWGRDRG